MIGIILAVLGGAFTGGIARAILPGTQNIGWPKTIGVGIAANLVVQFTVGLIFGFIISTIASVALSLIHI